MRDNSKHTGELGERIAIGELAKHGIEVLIPMGDNLPFDLVIYHNNKFFKCQVKTSTRSSANTEGSVYFSLISTNWHRKTEHFYTKEEVDIFILCDLDTIYLFEYEHLKDQRSISIRKMKSRNNQKRGITYASDVVISQERIDQVLYP